MRVEVRRSNSEDAQGIVDLFAEDGNPHNWSLDKWSHFYQGYPEGEVVAFVAESPEGVVGHYGLFPVVIGGYQVYLGAHAYISKSVRGLAVISKLMKALDGFCVQHSVPFIVGFANPRFTIVKSKLFKWSTPFYASFVSCSCFCRADYSGRPLAFEYSSKWLKWRFGNEVGVPVVSRYQENEDGQLSFQLLCAEKLVEASELGLSRLECWSPEGYIKELNGRRFAQPFSVKVYSKNWNGPDLQDPDNWFIQMGDSDTFTYKAI